MAEKLMWDNYHLEEDPSKKVKILESLIGIQPYVSGYYDSTRYVLEETVKADEDLHRNKRPYVGIDVEARRKKQFEEEEEERRFIIKERQAAEVVYNNDLQSTTDNSVNFATVQEETNEIESEPWANSIDNDTPIEKQPLQDGPVKEPESEVERYCRTHNPKTRSKGNTVHFTTR